MANSRLSSRSLAHLLGEWRGPGAAYERLADGIRMLSLDRRIAPGTALPAERDLAARLEVSRTTVAAAYRSLRESGHIESLRGSGSVLRPVGPVDRGPRPGERATIDLFQASPPAWSGLPEIYAEAASSVHDLVRRPGYEMVGMGDLRAAIAARYTDQGLATDPDQIIVTTGAQSAISLIASVVTRRGDRAAIETPTYPHAAEVLRQADAHLVAIPVDPALGWDMERAEHVLRRAAPSVAYLMPDFQNPTGAVMAPGDRASILHAARETGVYLIVDETTRDLAIDEQPPAPVGAGVDPLLQRQLITIGSLSKTVWGGLRIGWIRADHELVARLVAARPRLDLGTPEFEQAVAARALERMPEILSSRSTFLRASRDALVAGLRSAVPDWEIPEPAGGVALWVGLGAALSSPLALAVRERGVVLSSGPRFAADGGHERHLRIPFTAPVAQLRSAVELLAEAWERVRDEGTLGSDRLLAVV